MVMFTGKWIWYLWSPCRCPKAEDLEIQLLFCWKGTSHQQSPRQHIFTTFFFFLSSKRSSKFSSLLLGYVCYLFHLLKTKIQSQHLQKRPLVCSILTKNKFFAGCLLGGHLWKCCHIWFSPSPSVSEWFWLLWSFILSEVISTMFF